MKKILIAIDGGPTSEKIASAALQLGTSLRAEMAVLSVVDTNLLMTDGGVTPQEMAELMKVDLMKNQKVIIDKIFKAGKILSFVEKGNPHEIILKTSEEWQADLIVIGTHGKTGLLTLLMGNVAEKIIRHSARPILVIPCK
jgi:nucleotide-binding universal stress UspA family protein